MNDELPPELLNSDPKGYAWQVWHDRTPKLVAKIKDTNSYGPKEHDALDALLAEIFSGVMEPLGAQAHDREVWAGWGAEHFGKPWSEAPFLWSESYFYRRVLDAVGFFEPGPWRGVDPFAPLKRAELASLDDLEWPTAGASGQAKLLAALWGNRADLSFAMGTLTESSSTELVCDDSTKMWNALAPGAEVVVVADNAGRELLADLILIDHLLEHGHAASVALHLKPHPYYVSDATTTDLADTLDRLAETDGAPFHRLRKATADGRLSPYVHDFYCAPWSFRRLPADLAVLFERASLTIMKGDLNYRRLVGDRAWPATTPFADTVAYFPGPVAALRTLKSDVAVGIPPATLRNLDADTPDWRVTGGYGLLQADLRERVPGSGS
ncbi:damage-control phosphatase ARMT1 family protein [Streptosporangium sp. NPDC005286]|uniref:damage-control phosphatase ARMT1 family protein n=1 Tax=Streptosporangium sp. NPDC005286 TaxID=3154463 RepID=UPI00339E22C4